MQILEDLVMHMDAKLVADPGSEEVSFMSPSFASTASAPHWRLLAWQQRAKAEQTMTSTIGRLFLQIARNSASLMEHFGLSEQDPQFHSLVHAGPIFEHLLASLSFGHVKEDLKVGAA